MTGLGIVIPSTGPGVGPIIPSPLASPGVPGYTHRYSSARLTGADGAAVTSWTDSGSSPVPLTPGGAGTGTIVVNKAEAYPFVRLTGKQLVSVIAETAPLTFAVVVRKSVISQSYFVANGVSLSRAGNQNHQISAVNGGTGSMASANGSVDWTVVIATVVAPGGTQTLRAGTSEVANTTVSPGTPAVTQLGTSTTGQVADIAEVIIWSGLTMTAPQRVSVYNALKASYPLLTSL